MVKDNRKKPHDPIRALTTKWVAKKFEISAEYVRAALNGTATGGRVDDILKAYKEKYKEYQEVSFK